MSLLLLFGNTGATIVTVPGTVAFSYTATSSVFSYASASATIANTSTTTKITYSS